MDGITYKVSIYEKIKIYKGAKRNTYYVRLAGRQRRI